MKSRLGKTYPEAFRVCSDVYNMDDLLEEEEEEEEEEVHEEYETSRSSMLPAGELSMQKLQSGLVNYLILRAVNS